MATALHSKQFLSHVRKELDTLRPAPVIGFVWESIMYRSLKATSTKAVYWNPASTISGVDIRHDGVAYSLKTKKKTTPIATVSSYKLQRCKTEKDAVAEIDSHNFDLYSILTRDDTLLYGLYVIPSHLTMAKRFYWDYSDCGKFMTDTRDGISMEISGFGRSRAKKQLWITVDFAQYEDLFL